MSEPIFFEDAEFARGLPRPVSNNADATRRVLNQTQRLLRDAQRRREARGRECWSWTEE